MFPWDSSFNLSLLRNNIVLRSKIFISSMKFTRVVLKERMLWSAAKYEYSSSTFMVPFHWLSATSVWHHLSLKVSTFESGIIGWASNIILFWDSKKHLFVCVWPKQYPNASINFKKILHIGFWTQNHFYSLQYFLDSN